MPQKRLKGKLGSQGVRRKKKKKKEGQGEAIWKERSDESKRPQVQNKLEAGKMGWNPLEPSGWQGRIL